MVKRRNDNWTAGLERRLNTELPRVMQSAMLRVESEAKRIVYLGHPEHLNRVTGTLGRSITTETQITDEGSVISSVGTNIEYAPIHEFGGNTTHHGKMVRVPARPYLMPAWQSKKHEVADVCEDGIRNILQEECI